MKLANKVSTILRVLLGLALIATGIGKILDIPGFIEVLGTYELFPSWANLIIGYTVPFFELAIGGALVAKLRVRIAAWGAVLLHIVLLSIVIITLWRGIDVPNCGCFGVFLARPLRALTALEDTGMLAISIIVLKLRKV